MTSDVTQKTSSVFFLGLLAVLGSIQGLSLWGVDQVVEADGNWQLKLGLLMSLVVTPTVFYLTARANNWVASLLFSIVLGALLASLTVMAQLSIPDDNPYYGRDRFNETALSISICGSLIITYIAVPFFRTVWERKERPNHYPSLFEFAWTAPVVLAAAMAFVGACWAVLALIGGLFAVVGIDVVYDVMGKPWFGWPFTCAVGALGVGIVRESEKLILALRGILLLLARVVAPVFAVATLIFVVTLLFQGLGSIPSGVSPVAILCMASIAGIIFLNAIIEDGEPARGRLFRLSALAIAGVLLIFGALIAYGLYVRVAEHGLTPMRIIAMFVSAPLILYGILYAVAAAMKANWGVARQGNVIIAGIVAVLAMLIQTPLVNMTERTIASQTKLIVAVDDLTPSDIAFFSAKLGKPGRDELRAWQESAPIELTAVQREQIEFALAAAPRYGLERDLQNLEGLSDLMAAEPGRITIMPEGYEVPEAIVRRIQEEWSGYGGATRWLIHHRPDFNAVVFVQLSQAGDGIEITVLDLNDSPSRWLPYGPTASVVASKEEAEQIFEGMIETGVEFAPARIMVPVVGDDIAPFTDIRGLPDALQPTRDEDDEADVAATSP